MASTINASTSPAAIVQTADGTANLNLQSNGTTIAALTSTGMAVTGTLSASGVTTFAAGTAALPAITTTGDTNTGMWFPAADTIAFSEGGAEAVRIDSAGRVNIGQTTSTIGTILEVASVNSTFATGTPQIFARSTDALAIDTGGMIGLGGVANTAGTSVGGYAMIAGRKENATSANYLGYMAFATSNSGNTPIERMRIDSSGYLLVGCTSAPSASVSGIRLSNPTSIQSIFSTAPNTGAYTAIAFFNGNGQVGRIDTSGSSTVYVTSSDYRLKENIAPMTGALDKVALLKPVTYKWKIDGKSGDGFIAHELAEVCSDAVVGEKDAIDKEGEPLYQGIDTSFLVATLTAAIQEQQALITSLTARITALEGA